MNSFNFALHHPSRRLKRLPLALLLAGSASWSLGQAAESEAPPDPAPVASTSKPKADSGQLETVTVTARRREESSQSVPVPISVIGGQALESPAGPIASRICSNWCPASTSPTCMRASPACRSAAWATTRPAMAWRAASGCISTTST